MAGSKVQRSAVQLAPRMAAMKVLTMVAKTDVRKAVWSGATMADLKASLKEQYLAASLEPLLAAQWDRSKVDLWESPKAAH